MNQKNYKSDIDKDNLSLAKIKGSPIKEVIGYISTEFGEPVFKMTRIFFEDGTFCWCEGLHIVPYVTGLDVDFPNELNKE